MNKNLANSLKLIIEEKTILHSLIDSTEFIKDLLLLEVDQAVEQILANKYPLYLQDYLHIELLPLLDYLNF